MTTTIHFPTNATSKTTDHIPRSKEDLPSKTTSIIHITTLTARINSINATERNISVVQKYSLPTNTLVEQPIYIRQVIMIFSCLSVIVFILILLTGFGFYMRGLNISKRLENNLQRNIQTVNTNNIDELEQVEAKLNKLVVDIQGMNRILKAQERQIISVECEVFELSLKASQQRSLSSSSLNLGSNIDFRSSSAVINNENIGSIYILDPHV